jgi:hypothetical protein
MLVPPSEVYISPHHYVRKEIENKHQEMSDLRDAS